LELHIMSNKIIFFGDKRLDCTKNLFLSFSFENNMLPKHVFEARVNVSILGGGPALHHVVPTA
jgi:hypothetical protein